jgi:tetratricopeptide (TPR) repeat protein
VGDEAGGGGGARVRHAGGSSGPDVGRDRGAAGPPPARKAGAALVADGQRLEAAGDVAGALAAYEAARTADPRNVEASMLAGLVYHYQLDDPARAVACYRAVLAERPDHYGAHYHLATALLADGRTAEARAAWASFARLAEAIGDRATIASAPPPLRDALPAR